MKIKLLILAFILLSIPAWGQTYFGIKAGYTMSSVRFSPPVPNKRHVETNYDPGLMFKYFDTKYVGFQTELYLSNRGFDKKLTDTIAQKRTNTYLEMPLFIQFRVSVSVIRFHLNLGPYFSYLLKADVEERNFFANADEGIPDERVFKSYEFNILRDNRLDYGLLGGVGLSCDFRWGSFQVEGRFGFGLGDLYDTSYPDNPSQSGALFQSLVVSYCYIFGREKNKDVEKE